MPLSLDQPSNHLPVKNTFVHFDVPCPDGYQLYRSLTCPGGFRVPLCTPECHFAVNIQDLENCTEYQSTARFVESACQGSPQTSPRRHCARFEEAEKVIEFECNERTWTPVRAATPKASDALRRVRFADLEDDTDKEPCERTWTPARAATPKASADLEWHTDNECSGQPCGTASAAAPKAAEVLLDVTVEDPALRDDSAGTPQGAEVPPALPETARGHADCEDEGSWVAVVRRRLPVKSAPLAAPHAASRTPASASAAPRFRRQVREPAPSGNTVRVCGPSGNTVRVCGEVPVGLKEIESGGFRVMPRLLGQRGQRVRTISEETQARVSIRGHVSDCPTGSRFPTEAKPLTVHISAPDRRSYERAEERVRVLIEAVRAEYRAFATSRSSAPSEGLVPSPRSSTCSAAAPAVSADRPLPCPKQCGRAEFDAQYGCYFLVGIEEADAAGFGVIRRLLGMDGENIAFIEEETGAWLRVCGKGCDAAQASEGPLTLCIGAKERTSRDAAAKLAADLLEDLQAEYRDFLAARGQLPPEGLRVVRRGRAGRAV